MSKPAEKQAEQPQEIQLDEVDVLRLENFNLKISAIKKEGDQLIASQNAYIAGLSQKYGVDDLTKYVMDPASGKGRRVARPA